MQTAPTVFITISKEIENNKHSDDGEKNSHRGAVRGFVEQREYGRTFKVTGFNWLISSLNELNFFHHVFSHVCLKLTLAVVILRLSL